MKLEGRVAAITGGTRGIGRAIAEAFLTEGAAGVVVNGRSEEKGRRALEEMGAGGRADFVAGDVTRRKDVERVVEETVARYGRIDVMVNNAGGTGEFAPVAELSDEGWRETLDWNLSSAFWGTRVALRHMIPRGWGRIINVSSEEGKGHGQPGLSAYVASKHALNGFTLAASKEVGPLGVTVNAICPGLVMTDVVREQAAAAAELQGLSFEELIDRLRMQAAIRRTVEAEEVAAVAVLLASDSGAGIAGALLSVDGGIAAY